MFFSDEINRNNPLEIEEIKSFLKTFNIEYDNPDVTYVIRDDGNIIATGSAQGNILKYFFARCDYAGQGAISIIYDSLLNYIFEKGFTSYFIFTTPNNKNIFESLGLKEVHSTESVLLLEGGFYNYQKWVEKVKKNIGDKNGKRGAIIVNCNPMTLGHKYLIETAFKEVEELLVFVVEEDLSVFPFEDRIKIVANEFKTQPKVKVLKGGPYIISRGTFPTYFIKQKDKMLEIYTELDASIFAEKIAKDLSIDIRFLGSESKDIVTNTYNHSLKKILENNGLEVKIIDRIKSDSEPISASSVRNLLKENKLEKAFELLPNSTIQFLKSEKGKAVVNYLLNLPS